jgi:hypothetical protein
MHAGFRLNMNRLFRMAEVLFVVGIAAGVLLLLVVALGAAFILATIDEHSDALLVDMR